MHFIPYIVLAALSLFLGFAIYRAFDGEWRSATSGLEKKDKNDHGNV